MRPDTFQTIFRSAARCLAVALASAAVHTGAATAQSIEYTVTDIPPVPGAFVTVPRALNDQGVVVGWAQYSGSPSLRGWRWSAESGTTVLPAPPGAMSNHYAATDVNNLGVIAGDGGYDSGQLWRFENGSYTIIGSLPGLAGSRGPAINVAGTVVGNAFNPQSALTPTRAFVFTDESGIVDLFPESTGSSASDINDAGQIVARVGGSAIRREPDGSQTLLPIPPGFVALSSLRINSAGDVAGLAGCPHECNQAFLWTEETGVVVIPWVGTRHTVGDVNDQREVVGSVEEGVSYAWTWSPDNGLRLLASLIDPALTRNVVQAADINNAGQIITWGYDYSDSLNPFRIMLLTPIDVTVPGDLDGDGVVGITDFLALLAAWGPCPDCGACPADLDGDCTVGINDFLLLLANWS